MLAPVVLLHCCSIHVSASCFPRVEQSPTRVMLTMDSDKNGVVELVNAI